MQPEVAPLDPADEAEVDAVHALRVAADAVDVPDFPPPCRHAFRGELIHPVSSMRKERFVARLGGDLVGYLCLELPLRDNLDNAEVEMSVHPAHRRRGVGRALYAALVARMRALDRKRYNTMTVAALPGGPPRVAAGGAFAVAMGAKAALDEVRRRLDLATVEEEALAAMWDEALVKSTGYRLVTWRDCAPEEYAADICHLESRLFSDAPMGDLAWDPPDLDVAHLREREEARVAGWTRQYSAGAVHEQSGRLVALTALSREHSTPWHAFQWITLVDPPHRGHRLGALVKVANLRFARAHEPELRMIDTWNATVNRHMISINEAMGFRPVDAWPNWQQEI